MEMEISLPGGDRVVSTFAGLTVTTDQDGTAPTPLSLFFSSIGACAGFYVARFCRQRGIPTDGIRIHQRIEMSSETHMAGRIDLEIELPAGFPEQYTEAVTRAARQCPVKRHLEQPPAVNVYALAASPSVR